MLRRARIRKLLLCYLRTQVKSNIPTAYPVHDDVLEQSIDVVDTMPNKLLVLCKQKCYIFGDRWTETCRSMKPHFLENS